MAKNAKEKNYDELYKALLSLDTLVETRAFLRDLCTLDELNEMSERWEIVKMLKKDLTYRDIAEKLKVSTATVSRVAFWLNNGEGGYNLVFNKLAAHHSPSFKKRL